MCFQKKIFVFLFLSYSVFSQSYKIQGKIVGLQNQVCYLGHYWGNQQTIIYKDTAQIDSNGSFEFTAKKLLPEGNYVVRLPNKSQIELIISDQQNFSFSTQANNLINSMQIVGSDDNEKIYAYLKFLVQQTLATQSASIEVKNQYSQSLSLFKKSLFSDNSFLSSKIIKGGDEPELSSIPKLANGKTDSVALFYQYKNHYFDNLDLSDDRLIRTNYFEQKIKRFIESLTYQVPDSLIKTVDFLVGQTKGNVITRKYILSTITTLYENSKTVGLEAVFVHAFEKYYQEKPEIWDSNAYKNLEKRATTLKPLLFGKIIPEIKAIDLSGKIQSLHGVSAKYTILYIYSLTCNHCKEHAPKVAQLQRKLLSRGVRFYAIPVERNIANWKGFINTYHTENLLNVIDSKQNLDFTNQYNIVEFPTVFILDEDKKIIGRRINPALIEDYINFIETKK